MNFIYRLLLLAIFGNSLFNGRAQQGIRNMDPKKYYYLALGDSYTIGEKVDPADNYPNQVVRRLMRDSLRIQPPRIIAKTGWTSDELAQGISIAEKQEPLRPKYDFVSLLIGVNNQYRGQSAETYQTGFEVLLKKAIHFAGGNAARVVVLSIPDWSATPFASGADKSKIRKEIDLFNAINRRVASDYKAHYIDITPWTREAVSDPTLITSDGLHPSGKEYERWAEKICTLFQAIAATDQASNH